MTVATTELFTVARPVSDSLLFNSTLASAEIILSISGCVSGTMSSVVSSCVRLASQSFLMMSSFSVFHTKFHIFNLRW